jgi:hypothetical protein
LREYRVSFFVDAVVLRHNFVIRFLPIVFLALVFNITNAIGFTYAYVSFSLVLRQPFNVHLYRDRDAKQRWAASVALGGWNMGFGGLGGQIIGGVVKNSVGRAFGVRQGA